LLLVNIDLYTCDKNKDTIMHDAVKAYCLCNEEKKKNIYAQIIVLLIERGASYTRRNAQLLSPLDIAKEMNKTSKSATYCDDIVALFNKGFKNYDDRLNASIHVSKNRVAEQPSIHKWTSTLVDH